MFLQEHQLTEYDQLAAQADGTAQRFHALAGELRQTEADLAKTSALMEDVPPLAAIVAGLADTVTFQALHDAYCLFPADWVIVQLADLPAWVAVYVILRVLVEVLLPALTVFPDRLNPAALPEMTGVAVSVPVFTPLVYTSRAAEQVSVDVPPAAAIVVGLADMFTFQSP